MLSPCSTHDIIAACCCLTWLRHDYWILGQSSRLGHPIPAGQLHNSPDLDHALKFSGARLKAGQHRSFLLQGQEDYPP